MPKPTTYDDITRRTMVSFRPTPEQARQPRDVFRALNAIEGIDELVDQLVIVATKSLVIRGQVPTTLDALGASIALVGMANSPAELVRR